METYIRKGAPRTLAARAAVAFCRVADDRELHFVLIQSRHRTPGTVDILSSLRYDAFEPERIRGGKELAFSARTVGSDGPYVARFLSRDRSSVDAYCIKEL
jgi:hypothetical protein